MIEITPAMRDLLVKAALGRLAARQAEYDAECAEYAAKGQRPHYCIHGTNLWTDYDNICMGCEDDRSDAEHAEDMAADAVYRIERMSAAVDAAQGMFSYDTYTAMSKEFNDFIAKALSTEA